MGGYRFHPKYGYTRKRQTKKVDTVYTSATCDKELIDELSQLYGISRCSSIISTLLQTWLDEKHRERGLL